MAEDLFADVETAPREVQELLTRGENLLFVDVRESWEHDTARIEGAERIPLREIPSSLARFEDPGEVVFYCHHGIRSLGRAAWLCSQGIEGAAYIREALEEGVARGKVTREQRDKGLANSEVARSVQDACHEADLLIEAVPEEMEVKLEIFTIFDKFSKPHAILASNTSSLSITEMAAITFRAESCVGMHFFDPVPKMKLLEVVRGLETSDTTVAECVGVGLNMGKKVVVVRESPGFITSRINAMIGNAAFFMLQEGLASAEDIDTALKLGLNHPMGPFELVDLVGLDVRLSILEHLHKTLGEKCRPCPLLAQ